MKAKNVTFPWVAFNGDLSGPNMTFGRLTSSDTLLMSLYNTNVYSSVLFAAEEDKQEYFLHDLK